MNETILSPPEYVARMCGNHCDPTEFLTGDLWQLRCELPWTGGNQPMNRCFSERDCDKKAVGGLLLGYWSYRHDGVEVPGDLLAIITEMETAYQRYMKIEIAEYYRHFYWSVNLFEMESRAICNRQEFAYVVSLFRSFKFAYPYRDLLDSVVHGLDELRELLEIVPVSEFLEAFFGIDSRSRKWSRRVQWELDELEGLVFFKSSEYCYSIDLGDTELRERLFEELTDLVYAENSTD